MSLWPLGLNRLVGKLLVPAGRRSGRGPGKAAVEDTGSAPGWLWPLLVAVAVALLHFLLFPPMPRVDLEFPATGEIAQKEILAPFSFRAPNPAREVELERMERILSEPPALRSLGNQPPHDARRQLENWTVVLQGARARPDSSATDRLGDLTLRYPGIPPDVLQAALDGPAPGKAAGAMTKVLEAVYDGGVADLLPTGTYPKVWVLLRDAEVQRSRENITSQGELLQKLTGKLRQEGLAEPVVVWSASVLRHFIRPNLVYDAKETKNRQDIAAAAVPREREFVLGDRLVGAGERVTEQQATVLGHLQGLLIARGGLAEDGFRLPERLNRLLLIALAMSLYGWLGWIHFKPVLLRIRHLVALAVVVALFLCMAAIALKDGGLGTFAVPITLLALLATVLLKDRVGYPTTMLVVFLLGVLPEVGASAILVWIVLGLATVLAVRRIQFRSQFYQTIALLTLLSVFLTTVMRLSGGEGLQGLGREYLIAVVTPVFSVALALFLLPIIEPIVGVSSDLTLLELSDLNHPLLKRMALEAQGTYHHSQVVGQLAEQAARAIGANALLTRVGALFHDIGKMQKSSYFVENQSDGLNKHDELSPRMSALIVADHVKNGIELARKNRLPQAVIDFIPEHHGTCVMEFFYHKALQTQDSVKVEDFRYPGPKPQRRETAIMMLADAVEAATRSLKKPTPSRIKEMTKQVMEKRLLDGELDESSLSISDLAKIREAFIPLLTGIHHARITYPGQKEREVEKKEERKAEV